MNLDKIINSLSVVLSVTIFTIPIITLLLIETVVMAEVYNSWLHRSNWILPIVFTVCTIIITNIILLTISIIIKIAKNFISEYINNHF